jgi:hypothetical protein
MYFKNFPNIFYKFNIAGEDRLMIMKDITSNIRIKKQILNNIVLFDNYDIIDGETPELIAEKLYGNPNLHWVIMLCNEKYHHADEFPLTQSQLNYYVTEKYGSGNEYSQHYIFGRPHFVDLYRNIVDGDHPDARQVTNYDFEFAENEKLRTIKVINPKIISKVVAEIQSLFEENNGK